VRAAFGTSTLPVIGLKELLRNKRASRRPKDLADADRLKELSKGRRSKEKRAIKQRKKSPRR
jgi:hypothetical protein